MKRSIYFRLFIVVLVTSMSVLLFSYVRARSSGSKSSDPCSESGRCNGGKAKSEIILLESLTHNLLVSSR
jgi:hypothetical protein